MFLVSEELSLLIIMMGLYSLLFQRRWRPGLIPCALGVAASRSFCSERRHWPTCCWSTIPTTRSISSMGTIRPCSCPLSFTVLGIARLVRWLGPRWGKGRVALAASSLVLLLCLVTAGFWSPLADETRRAEFRMDEQSRAEQALLSQIPPEAGVVFDERFAAALATREGYYLFGGLYEHEYPIEYLIYEDTPIGFPAHPPALVGAPGDDGWRVPRWELLGSAGQTELLRQRGTLGAAPLPQPEVFEGGVALRGATGGGQPLAAAPGQHLEVALVWENQGAGQPRLVPFLQLTQRQGESQHRWASVDREPYGGLFPTDQWGPGSVVGEVYGLDLPPWLPPGEYELRAGLYARESQQRLTLPDGSTTSLVGTVEVAAPVPLVGDKSPEVPIRLDAPMAEGLALYGQNPISREARPGGIVDVILYWQATAPLSQAHVLRFDLVPEDGSESLATWQRSPVDTEYPTTEWESGVVVAGWYSLSLAPDLPPGRCDLLVTASGGPAGPTVLLVTLEILE